MSLSQKGKEAGIRFNYKGTLLGLLGGGILSVICSQALFAILGPIIGFFLYDRPKYKEKVDAYLLAKVKAEEEQQKLEREQKEKEEKREQRKLRAVQKKNRENKASLYENIYTVAGFILANQEDLAPYVKNAEDVISYFKASKEERRLAVEAFNTALDPDFNVEEFIFSYTTNIGKNRDYINYVLTYALYIATVDENIHYDAKDRLVAIGKALGSSQAALKRLFKSNGAEARFAREFENAKAEDLSKSRAVAGSGENKDSAKGSENTRQSSSSKSSSSKMAEALEILLLDSSATFDDIRKAHKKLMLKYHPDRLAAQGLTEDMIAIYTDKAKAIQAAFEYLKKLYSDYV